MHNCEIERKFIIVHPGEAWLAAYPQSRRKEIEQVYLTSEPGWERRVRRCMENGDIRCTETRKESRAGLCRTELERIITPEEYDRLLAEREPGVAALRKIRWVCPYESHFLEIDCYPFWRDKAVLEVELSAPDEAFSLPPDITVLREATDDPELKNHALAMATRFEAENR